MVNEASGKAVSLSEGDIMLFLPDEYHRQYSDSGAPVRYITITFDMEIDDPSLFAGKAFHTGPRERELILRILEEQEQKMCIRDSRYTDPHKQGTLPADDGAPG